MRITRHIGLAALVLCVAPRSGRARGADELPAHSARRHATEMYEAFLRGNYDGFVDHTHPKLVALMGGRPKVIEAVRKMLADAKAQGLVLSAATVGEARQVTKSEKRAVQVILPTELVFSAAAGELHQPSFLLGLSEDDGKNWKFTDTGQTGAEALRKLFPECSPALKIPPRPESRFVPRSDGASPRR